MSFSLVTANPISNVELILRVFIALVIGSVVGIDREYKNRPAGLRTHTLVCLGACTIALIECMISTQFGPDLSSHVTYTFGRLGAQVISGIGFLGAGTIFTAYNKKISGLTTAASLWVIACLGLATGYGYYWGSLLGCVAVMMILLVLQKLLPVNSSKRVEMRFVHRKETIAFINEVFRQNHIDVLDLDFHVETSGDPDSDDPNVYTNIYMLHLPSTLHYANLINTLSEFQNIQVVRTTNF
ncbi:MAG: MgtC/SapB family protein [Clostridia bacterium]|nr:MgtC/SapB family protein [Clostridia bacterium]